MDLSRVLQVLCRSMLSDLIADIVKVEPPDEYHAYGVAGLLTCPVIIISRMQKRNICMVYGLRIRGLVKSLVAKRTFLSKTISRMQCLV